MANSHAAFFGDETREDPQRGVPADLLPYLEAADAPDEDGADGDTTGAPESAPDPEAEEAERAAALRALVEHSLLLGPDPSVLAEIEGDEEDEEWLDEDGNPVPDTRPLDPRGTGTHAAALDAAADDLALDARVREVTDAIISRAPEHRVQPSLDRVREVLDILGDPQATFPSVHITGTNGKTSTARMVDSLLSALGMRVGRFTSPHLVDARERISIEGEPISRADFLSAWEDVAPYVQMVDARSQADGGPRLSFFEVFTVLAFDAFAFRPVDVAVVEVGMGGRWDATNVMDGDVAVIMPISRDHSAWLGSTLEEIATEKAGIIKPRQTVVVASQEPEVERILLARAAEVDAVVRLEGRDFEVVDRQMGVGGQLVTVRTPSAVYEDVFVPLLGEHQAHNAAAALVAAEALCGGRRLDGRLVEQGFVAATSPGRLQVVRTSPTVVVDAAHNPAGAGTLAGALGESFDFRRVVGVFSAMRDKEVEAVLAEVEPVLDHLVVTGMEGERAMPVDELAAVAVDVFGEDRVDVQPSLVDAVERAVELAEATSEPMDTTGVVVFGSVHLAGDVLALFGKGR